MAAAPASPTLLFLRDKCEVSPTPTPPSGITGNAAPAGSGGGAFITASAGDEPLVTDSTVCDNAPNQIAGGTWTDGGGNTVCGGCPGDLDGNGVIDGADLTQLLADWGCTGDDCVADLDGSGLVDGADLTIILSAWGDCEQGQGTP